MRQMTLHQCLEVDESYCDLSYFKTRVFCLNQQLVDTKKLLVFLKNKVKHISSDSTPLLWEVNNVDH